MATLLTALALIGVSATPAVAHATLVATNPAAGAAVGEAPATVTLQFGEPVQVTSDGIRVLGADGSRADRGDAATVPGHSDSVSATLRPGLGQGTYTVAWRVTSADSHPVHGAFAFSVGGSQTVAVPLAGVDRGSDPAVAALVHIARGAGYSGLALLVGATGTGLLLDGSAGRSTIRKQARIGGLTLTLSAALSLLAQGPYAAGTGLDSLVDPDLLHSTLSGRTGVAEVVRVVLAAALTLPAALTVPAAGRSPADRLSIPAEQPDAKDRSTPGPSTQTAGTSVLAPVRPRVPPPPRGGRWARTASYAYFVPLVALAATFSATGHPVAGRYVPLAFTADLLHLMAMGLWLGGLVALAVLCTSRAASAIPPAPAIPELPGSLPPPSVFTAAVRRFSPLAAWCVGVLALTGTLQSIRQLGSVGDLAGTGWGRYLVVKLAVVLGLLTLAYRARSWTRQYAAGRRDPSDEPARATLCTMRRTLAVEASVGAVVLALSVMLAGSAPPSDRTLSTNAVTQAVPAPAVHLHAVYDTGGAGGSGTATALLKPRPNGSVAVDVTLTTSDDVPAHPAEVTASMSLPALNVGPLPLDLEPSAPGHWTATTTLTPKGEWQLALIVRTSDVDETAVLFPPTAA